MIEELTTDRGDLARQWLVSDADAVVAAFEDPSMDSQRDDPILSRADAEQWIAGHRDRWAAGSAYSWAVASDGNVAASVSVSSVDRRHGLGWVSYWTAPHARGLGVTSSALRAIATWAFGELGLFRLELGHRVNNPSSCHVATAAGFIAEGIERQKLRYGDGRFDVEIHARLATDPVPPSR